VSHQNRPFVAAFGNWLFLSIIHAWAGVPEVHNAPHRGFELSRKQISLHILQRCAADDSTDCGTMASKVVPRQKNEQHLGRGEGQVSVNAAGLGMW